MNKITPHDIDLTGLVTNIVNAYVKKNNLPASELPNLIVATHAALVKLGAPPAELVKDHKVTAAQIRKSVTPDHITSFLNGKPDKSLKRHLTTQGYTPIGYRQKFGLGHEYPMVASNYAAQRSELAKNLGLGQIRRDRAAARNAEGRESRPRSGLT